MLVDMEQAISAFALQSAGLLPAQCAVRLWKQGLLHILDINLTALSISTLRNMEELPTY